MPSLERQPLIDFSRNKWNGKSDNEEIPINPSGKDAIISISDGLAKRFLEQALEENSTLEIPSLGIVIRRRIDDEFPKA